MGLSRQECWSGLPFPSPKGTIERKKVKSLSRVRLLVTPRTANIMQMKMKLKELLKVREMFIFTSGRHWLRKEDGILFLSYVFQF